MIRHFTDRWHHDPHTRPMATAAHPTCNALPLSEIKRAVAPPPTSKETDTGICSKSDGRMHPVARRKKQSGRRDPGVIFPGGPFHQKQGRAGMGA